DGLSRDDGPALDRTASRAEGDGIDLLALRSDGQPLLEDADGCHFRTAILQKRDHLAEDFCSCKCDPEIRSSPRRSDFLFEDRQFQMESATPTVRSGIP